MEDEEKRQFLIKVNTWLMQNAKPVIIPFRYSFPTDPCSRRDKMKFQTLIKSIANAHQLQWKIIEYKGKKIIVADRRDFEIALEITEPFLRSTVMTLDKYALAIIDYAQQLAEDEEFTAAELLAALDVKRTKLFKTLTFLEQQRLLEYAEELKPGTPTRYRLTDAGKQVSNVEIRIVDDGSWLTALYDKLDDPATKQTIIQKFQQIWQEEDTIELRDAEAQKQQKLEKAKLLHQMDKVKNVKAEELKEFKR